MRIEQLADNRLVPAPFMGVSPRSATTNYQIRHVFPYDGRVAGDDDTTKIKMKDNKKQIMKMSANGLDASC